MSILNREGSVLDHVGSRYVDIDTDELLDRIRTDLHPQQKLFFDNQNEIVGLSAGYGAGKTRALCSVAVKLAAQNIGFIGAILEPVAPLIRDIWITDFDQFSKLRHNSLLSPSLKCKVYSGSGLALNV